MILIKQSFDTKIDIKVILIITFNSFNSNNFLKYV